MAKYQYRLSGELAWMSSSGSAIAAIINPMGSGKKLTLRSFEIYPINTAGAAVASSAPNLFRLASATIDGGETVSMIGLDTGASFPATVTIRRNAIFSSPGDVPFKSFTSVKQLVPSTIAWATAQRPHGFAGRIFSTGKRALSSTVEGIVVRAGESIALYPHVFVTSVPLRVSVAVVVSGSPNRTFTCTYFVNLTTGQECLFALVNNVGSGQVVTLRSISVEEVGTFDTPYFQLVPIGNVEAVAQTDALARVSLLKLDTAYPDPTSWVKVFQNVPVAPYGVPSEYLAQASGGSPKGVNYLHTKDFVGPVYRTLFPEFISRGNAIKDDMFGSSASMRLTDMLVRRSGITVREGEGLALVSGAETAVLATAVGMSGWSCFTFGAHIDVEPKLTPTLRLTGLQPLTEVRLFQAGTQTLLGGIESVSGEWSWQFDPEATPSIDISILSKVYRNQRILGLALTLADVTVPIQQEIDRQFLNP